MDTDTIKKAFWLVVTVFVRYGIVFFCSSMLEHRFMTQSETELLENPVVYAAFAGAIIAFVLGAYASLRTHFATLVALRLPKNSTHNDVKAVIADSTVMQIVQLTPDSKTVEKQA